ncbi:SRPBCC family protein [Leifsonia sp. McL0607]|uniref:SRPBCC family protein n=1 Tax=Leifsonia sp. McL0607 TaxID=3415672 RepID=UPI003CF85D94
MTTLTTFEFDEFLPHPPAKLWRVLSEPDLLAGWLMPHDGYAPVVGTRFEFRTEPVPQTSFSGVVQCEVLEVDPGRLLRISWSSEGTALDTVVTWRLVAEGTGTRLLLTQEGFDLDDPDQSRAFQIMNGGWRSRVFSRMVAALEAM